MVSFIFCIILGILYLIFKIVVWIVAFFIHCVKKKFLEFEAKDRERNRMYEEEVHNIDKNSSETIELLDQEAEINKEDEGEYNI